MSHDGSTTPSPSAPTPRKGLATHAANALTLSRVVLVLPFWIALARPGPAGAWIAAGCVLFMELSDLLDGTLARRLGAVSDLGKLLDPAADSFSRLSVFLALAVTKVPGREDVWFPAWGVVLLLFRDVGVSFLRQVAAARGTVVAARTSGKVKALFQGGAIWATIGLHVQATLAGHAETWAPHVAWGLGILAIGVTLLSLVDYALAVLLAGPHASGKS